MTTSGRSPANDCLPTLELFPTSSLGLPPAKTSAAPTPGAKASMAKSRASSSKPSVSLERSALVGSLLRTAIASELEAMTGSPQRWKHTVTTAGRSWWALEMPAGPISASEPGSLAWTPTPRANKGGLPDSHGWTPTPVAQAGSKKGGGELGGGGSAARKRVEELAILWAPTPTKSLYGSNVALGADGKRTGKKRSSLASLASSVGLSGRLILAAIYEHMMGYPVGWLSNAARLTATPSPPKSPKP